MTSGTFPLRFPRAVGAVVALSLLAACSSPSSDPTPPAPAPSPSSTPAATAETSPAPDAVSARELAPRLLAVGITDFDHAARAVDLGVRHLFIGTGADFTILNGQGDPARSLAALEKRAGEPLTVSVDEEGGLVQRLSEIIGSLPSARDMAATMTPTQVRELMAEHGRKMKELGITVDFAPVVDLGAGAEISDNAIGSRAFSTDPAVVVEYGRAYAEGLLDAGITPVLKHFPGHGHASGDSHHGVVTVPPRAELETADLVPFQQLMQIPGIAVMVGHVQSPDINPDLPASISPEIYQLLRGGWSGKGGFAGVIYTDDMTGMAAVTDRYTGHEATAAALRAGADQALAAAGAFDIDAAIERITADIENGKIPTEPR